MTGVGETSQARRSELSSTSPETKKDNSLYAKCIVGFAEMTDRQKHLLMVQDDWVYQTGARVGPALKFWETLSPFGHKVVDLAACIPSEMLCARKRGWVANAYNPDPAWSGIVRDLGYTHLMGIRYVKGCDVIFVDWDWGDCKKGDTLTLPSTSWLHSHQVTGASYGASLVVMKCLRKVEYKTLPYTIHVSRPEHNTAYTITARGRIQLLSQIITHFENSGYDVQILDDNTERLVGLVNRQKREGKVIDAAFELKAKVAVLTASKAKELLMDEDLQDLILEAVNLSHGWENSEDFMNAISTSTLSDLLKLLQGSSHLFEELLSSLLGFSASFPLRKSIKALVEYCISLKMQVLPELLEEFQGAALKLAQSPWAQAYDVEVGGEQGRGFFCDGALIIPYHVSKARPVHIGEHHYKAHTVDTLSDLVSYGGPIPKFFLPERNDKIYVKGFTADLVGRVVRKKPLQVVFPGAPVPGLSGSPMMSSDNQVVGVYSNHFLDAGVHLTIPTKNSWAGTVAELLSAKDRLNVYVPCSNGKTTILPKVVAAQVPGKVMVVVPRANLTDATAKFMGPDVRGFSGDEAIDDGDAKVVLVTHGKFLSYLQGGVAFLEDYDVLMIDEAHDCTALTKMCLRWAFKHWDKKLIFMTGSPDDSTFGDIATEHQRFSVKRTVLPSTKPLTDAQIFKLLSEDKTHSYLVQVATKKKAKDMMRRIPNSVLISRETVQEKGLGYFMDGLKKETIRVAFITNVVNFGATLPVDKIIISGDVIEMETRFNAPIMPVPRILSYSELLQYIGRVGRVREGEAIMPNLKWTKPALSQQEDLMLKAWEYLLDPDAWDEPFLAHGFEASREQLATALKLDGALSHTIGLVDTYGMAYAKDEAAIAYCEERGIPWTTDSNITDFYGDKVGPYTGYDPSAPLQTGILSIGALITSIVLLFKPKYVELKKPVDMFAARELRSFRKGFKINSFKFKCIEPGIKVTALNEKIDGSAEVFFDSISTSCGWLSRVASFFCPVVVGGCEVKHSLFDSGKAQSVAYWLAGHGIRGTYYLSAGDDPLLSKYSTDTQLTVDDEKELSNRFGKSLLVSTGKAWDLVPSFLGLILGPLALFIPACIGVFRYHEPTVKKWPRLSAFVRSFTSSVSKDDFAKSGVAAVMSVSTSWASLLQLPLSLTWLSGMIWNLKLGKLSIPLSLKNKWLSLFASSGVSNYLIGVFLREHLGRWSSVLRIGSFVRANDTLKMIMPLLEAANIYRPASLLGLSLTDVATLVLAYATCMVGWYYKPVKFWSLLYPLFFLLMELWMLRFSPHWAFVPALGLLAFFSKLQVQDLRCMLSKGGFSPHTQRDNRVRVEGDRVFKRVATVPTNMVVNKGELVRKVIRDAVENTPRGDVNLPFAKDWQAATELSLLPDVYIECGDVDSMIFLPVSTSQNMARVIKIKQKGVPKAQAGSTETEEKPTVAPESKFSYWMDWFAWIVTKVWDFLSGLWSLASEYVSTLFKKEEPKATDGVDPDASKDAATAGLPSISDDEKVSTSSCLSSESSVFYPTASEQGQFDSPLWDTQATGSLKWSFPVLSKQVHRMIIQARQIILRLCKCLIKQEKPSGLIKRSFLGFLRLSKKTFVGAMSFGIILFFFGFLSTLIKRLSQDARTAQAAPYSEYAECHDAPLAQIEAVETSLTLNLTNLRDAMRPVRNACFKAVENQMNFIKSYFLTWRPLAAPSEDMEASEPWALTLGSLKSYLRSVASFALGLTLFRSAINVGVFPVETIVGYFLTTLVPARFVLLYFSTLCLSRGIFDYGLLFMGLASIMVAQDKLSLDVACTIGAMLSFNALVSLPFALILHAAWFAGMQYAHSRQQKDDDSCVSDPPSISSTEFAGVPDQEPCMTEITNTPGFSARDTISDCINKVKTVPQYLLEIARDTLSNFQFGWAMAYRVSSETSYRSFITPVPTGLRTTEISTSSKSVFRHLRTLNKKTLEHETLGPFILGSRLIFKTKWVTSTIISAVLMGVSYLLHPILFFVVAVQTFSFMSASVIWASRFPTGTLPEFDKSLSKLLSHTNLGDSELPLLSGEGPPIEIPSFEHKRVLVIGAAGSSKWLEKAIGLYYDHLRVIGDVGFLLIVDEALRPAAQAFARKHADVKVLTMALDNPAQMRMARLAPLFWGDSNTLYMHRDADWMITPLEVAAIKLEDNVVVNPIGVSVSANMLASINYWGSFGAHMRSQWWASHSVWHVYGTDEQLCDQLEFNHVYNRLTPNEQALFTMCARKMKFSKPRFLYIPIEHLHNSHPHSWNIDFRKAVMKSFGTTEWMNLIHDLSASEETYCASRTKFDIVSTGYANWYFLAAASAQLILRDLIEKSFLTSGIESATLSRVQTSLSQLCFSLGSLMGVASGARGTMGAYHKGVYLSALRSENGRNVNEFSNYDKKFKLGDLFQPDVSMDANESSIKWFCLLANPIAYAIAILGQNVVAIGDVLSLHVALTSICMGHPLSILSGVIRITSTCIEPSQTHCWAESFLLPLAVATGKVGWFSWNPKPGIVAEIEIPFLGRADSEVVKAIYPRIRTRGWISGWAGCPTTIHALPSGMINLRTSTFLALSRHSLMERQRIPTVIFGSGLGGIAQALLHENLASELTLYTLDDPGFNTDPGVLAYAKEKGVSTRVLYQDFRDSVDKYERVILDVARPVDDRIWYCDDFSHRDEQEAYELECLMEANSRVITGGSFIASLRNEGALTQEEFIAFLCIHYARVLVVEDPLRRTTGFIWFVCEKKLARRDPYLSSLRPATFDWIDWRFPQEWLEFFEAAKASHYEIIEPVPSYWYPKLFQIFKPPLCTKEIISWSIDPQKYLHANLSIDSLEFIEGAPLTWTDAFQLSWASKDLISSRQVVRSGCVMQVGRTVALPVPDREFNAGADLISIAILSAARVLPLDFVVDVPSQTNYALLDGLRKRYDFPVVRFDPERSWRVFSQWADYLGQRARGYDFGVSSWDEIREHAYRKSTMGYMSQSPFKNVGAALDEENYMEDFYQSFIRGSMVNLGFHGSPKVEKKEITQDGAYAEPRIFLYKTGEVRLCEMRITKKLNDFLLSDKYNPHASSGDIFYRASKIVQMFEKRKKPAAYEGESSKFDGHLEAELLVQLRRFFARVASYGENATLLCDYIQSMTKTDVLPNVYMCSGDVVSFLRGCMASGLWCTSCGDSAINEIPSFIAKMEALNITFEETFERFDSITCGDDKIEVGEEEDVAKVLAIRNETYEEFGITQTSENRMVLRPEFSSFCSHGYTRVTHDICVPLRDLNELFARLIVPCANGQLQLDLSMASRSLSSVISLVATYWYLPEIVHFYELVKRMVPKDVIPAAVDRNDRWKFEYNLGGLDPISFDVETFLIERFGRDPRKEVQLNPYAATRLNLHKFRRLLAVSLAEASKTLQNLSDNTTETEGESIWYEESFSLADIFKDLEYMSIKSKIVCFFERSSAAREYLRTSPLSGVTVAFGTLKSVLGRAKTKVLWIMFKGRNNPSLKWFLTKSASFFRNSGFRGEKIYLASIEEDTFTLHKTVQTGHRSPIVILICIILGVAVCVVPKLQIMSTGTKVAKGNLIAYNQGDVLTSVGEVKQRLFGLSEPRILEGFGIGKWLALENMDDKVQFYSLKRNDALKTVDTLVKLTRRFGLVVYDSMGTCSLFVVYVDGFEPKVGAQAWVNLDEIRELNDKLGQGELLEPLLWRTNGAMITVSKWEGEYHYGQMERPSSFYKSLEHRLISVALFVRISDCGLVRKDGRHGNVYCFPDYKLSHLPKLAPIIGESTGPMLIDIPKPYDADILGVHPTEVVDWSHKKLEAIFYGGSTGSGTTARNNVRVWLVQEEKNIEKLTGIPCRFRFTSMTNRIVRSIGGKLGVLKDGDYPVCSPVSLGKQSESKIIVVPEGHEAPDRVLGMMMTHSIVVIIRPTHVITTTSWFSPLIKDMVNCLLCDANSMDLVQKLSWIKSNDEEAYRISRKGAELALSLSRDSVMRNYMLSVVAMIEKGAHTRKDILSFVNWKMEVRGSHRMVMKDLDHHYEHGTAYRVDSSAFHVSMMRCDVGCGCALSKPVEFSVDMENRIGLIKRGDDIYESADHLTEREHMRALTLAHSVGVESRFITQRLGTLGGGNHFIELVWNKGKTYWMVHTGSRGLSQLLADRAMKNNTDGVGVAKMLDKASQAVAKLNREVIMRMLGAEVMDSWVHTKLVDLDNELWFVRNLISEKREIPLLSSPGTGFVMVENKYNLCPHGMGRKGSRDRPVSQADLSVYYQTVCCVNNTWWSSLGKASLSPYKSLMRAIVALMKIKEEGFELQI